MSVIGMCSPWLVPCRTAWLGRVKGLSHWGEVSAALDGFAASLKEKEFVNG